MNAVVRIHRGLKRMARPFSPWSRRILTAALLAFLIGNTYLANILSAPPNIDERAWVDRSLQPLWDKARAREALHYYYAKHHPSFARIAYGFTLHRLGVYECEAPLVDYFLNEQTWPSRGIARLRADRDLVKAPRKALLEYAKGKVGWELNLALGAYTPLEIETALRLVNAAFLSGMVALVYLGFKHIFNHRALALLGCLPIIFNRPVFTGPRPYTGAGPYLGTDCMLLFWLAAFWLVWILVREKGTLGVAALAVVGGFLVSTKLNGAFALVGACAYYTLAARGVRRLLWPALLISVSALIFIAMNPVYRSGDLRWMVKVSRDVIRLMFFLKDYTAKQDWGQFTRWQVLASTFPHWFFYLPSAAVILAARREKWLGITAAWALPTILLNWLLIYVPFPRYAAPISTAFLVLFSAAGLRLLIDFANGMLRAEEPEAHAEGGTP